MKKDRKKKERRRNKKKQSATYKESEQKKTDDVEVCEICMEEWEEETEEEETWIGCDNCGGWFHAKCIDEDTDEINTTNYTCMCTID